ncbi:MAG: undecaprenyldiphospho-muramoylpentapeptide beta-N-acetylglucosaminyltransferase [Betaproteobacteria bacterium]|nr:undecaprenyldiphospho-muramoylpentapeptide beta-N-acetylglucosaminyltransferase [Betaproteobacteria bacterium]
MTRTIMIMAGGTGGHIFPALSVADYLRAQGWNIVWLGARSGMEGTLIPPRGYTMAWVRFSGIRGKGLLSLVLLPLNLLIAFWQSARAIFLHRPDVVLGMGGYVAFPGGMMASLLNRPLVIHEQNSVAGLANRVLARLADRILAAFPGAFGTRVAAAWVGNPVREDIAALEPPEARLRGRSGRLQLLVIGGSLGAQVLNETVPRALAQMPQETRPRVTHQSGTAHIAALHENYRRAGVAAELVPFIDDMAARYAAADLVVCRAGATTIAELAAAGIASVLVPYPHAVDDHQMVNARYLVERGAAVLIRQSEFTAEKLAGLLSSVTREKIMGMAAAARAAAKPEATRAVAEACMELAT